MVGLASALGVGLLSDGLGEAPTRRPLGGLALEDSLAMTLRNSVSLLPWGTLVSGEMLLLTRTAGDMSLLAVQSR